LSFLACEIPQIPEAAKLGQSTQSAYTQAVAKNWIQSCVSSHKGCAATVKILSNLDSSQLPARLLDLREANVTRSIRVVHTKLETIDGPYVTLSHCWGANPPVKLKKANLEQYTRHIEMKSLPRTFRDAIEVCGWYNCEY
jgi:hypothetical protein